MFVEMLIDGESNFEGLDKANYNQKLMINNVRDSFCGPIRLTRINPLN